MILYDDKHNFLGMSSQSLSFLGYEDIEDFISINNDFANLFVNKEGYIYNYDSFNWIDFILYSGSANKSALLTLKNGKETKVQLSITEVFLTNEINEIKKLYSVKLISEKFNEISGVPKSSKSMNSFNLGGLATEAKEETAVSNSVEKNGFTKIDESTSTTTHVEPVNDFVLNIANDEPKEETNNISFDNIKEDEAKQESSFLLKNSDEMSKDFVLNMDEDKLEKSTPQTEVSSFLLKHDDETLNDFVLKEEKQEISNFTFNKNEEEIEKEDDSFLIKNDTTSSNDFVLNIANDLSDNKEEEIKESNFLLKNDEIEIETHKSLEKEENVVNFNTLKDEPKNEEKSDNTFKLDFLKTNLIQEEKTTETSNDKAQEYKTVDNSQIIKQIKKDIKEIDSIETKSDINIPITPQIEQPMQMRENYENKNDSQTLSDLQINENKNEKVNKSFTSTLQGLFGASKQDLSSNSDDKEDESFKNDEPTIIGSETKKDEDIFSQKMNFTNSEKKPDEVSHKPETDSTLDLSSLTQLGLSHDDELDLLQDFCTDTQESINMINQLTHTEDFDKINYSLVKIKSSAEILNLNDIIESTNDIRKHCITENSDKVVIETAKLKEKINLLQEQLEVQTV